MAAGTSPETLRGHTLEAGEHLRDATTTAPPTAAAPALALSLGSTFIRSREAGERHLEVRLGDVEAPNGDRRVFGAVARTETDIAGLIRRSLESLGRTGAFRACNIAR